jgi:hypothetical protein
MAYGNVYVFNCFNEKAQISVTGYSAGPIAAWQSVTGSNPYQPSAVTVPRIKHNDERSGAAFADDGGNSLNVGWDSGICNGIPIDIPTTGLSIDEDLVLYITHNQAILLRFDGFVLGQQPLTVTQLAR